VDESQDAPARASDDDDLAGRLGLTESLRPKKTRGRRALVITLVLLLALLLAAGGVVAYFFFRINSAIDSLDRDPSLLPSSTASAPTSEADNSPVTFVLMGSDSRSTEASEGRSDVLMVAYLSGDRSHVYLTSFPRDMWVAVPGYGQAKINAAYAWGGPALTVQTLESLTDVRMDHAVVIDFEGFINLTTTLGGVTVDNKYASSSNGYTFPQGQITLQGEEALAYVRERYDLPNGDLDRAERQRAVVSAIIDKVVSPQVLTDPGTFGDVVDQVASCVTVDSGLTTDSVWSLARSLKFTGSEGVRSLQAPISGFGTSADGQAIDIVDEAGLAELGQAMAGDTMDEYWQTHK